MSDHRRTIEDRIQEQDRDWKRAQNSATAWAYQQMDDGPEDIHDRRYQSVIEGERRDLADRGGQR